MRRFLVVGCGGSGGATLAYLMDQLRSDLAPLGVAELPSAWQFVHIDVPNKPERGPGVLGNVEQQGGTYFGCSPQAASYAVLDDAVSRVLGEKERLDKIATWAPRRPKEVVSPISVGAGQFRAVGRMISLSRATAIRAALATAWNTLNHTDTRSEMRAITAPALRGHDLDPPIVLMVSSMAGGAGASMALDVCRLLTLIGGIDPRLIGVFMVAPNIFDGLPEASRTGVRPNALAMLGEIVASQTGAARDHDESILQAVGLPGGEGAVSPFARVFPVGLYAGTDRTQFGDGSANAVYRGLGRGLAGLMMSSTATNQFVSYDLGNTASIDGERDLMGWGSDWESLQWGSYGFASLSMGRDRYAEYSAQRIARSCVDRLLKGHVQPGNTAPSLEQVDALLGSQWRGVCHRAGLPAQTEEVKNWLKYYAVPDDDVKRDVSQAIRSYLQDGVPNPNGLQPQVWRQAVGQRLREIEPRLATAAETSATQRVFAWHRKLRETVDTEVADAIATIGLPYAVAVVDRLRRHVVDVVALGADRVAAGARPDLAAIPPAVTEQLSRAKGTIVGGDTLVHALLAARDQDLRDTVHLRAAAVAAEVLRQFAVDVLTPLKQTLTDLQMLLEQSSTAAAVDLGLARLATDQPIAWPSDDDERVPERFDEADNEVLLTSSADFSAQYRTDLQRAVGNDRYYSDARATVIAQVVSGRWRTSGGEQAPGEMLISTVEWRPQAFPVDPNSQKAITPQQARYDALLRPAQILDRARMFVGRRGESFDQFCRMSITDYVRARGVSVPEAHARHDKVVSAFVEALSLARPLISVNPTALQAVHRGRNVEYRYKFSEVPFLTAPSTAEEFRKVLITDPAIDRPSLDNLGSAIGDTQGITRIDIFGSYPNYSPLVFDAVLGPVSEQWAMVGENGRELFWRWRRSRPLDAALPMSDTERRTMVAGWLLGHILGRIRIPAAPSYNQPVAVYDAEQREWVEFPHPLLTPPRRFEADYDWLPAVLESVLLAIAKSHEAPVMSSLRPYRVLRRIYDASTEAAAGGMLLREIAGRKALTDWLAGAAPGGASAIAGTADATVDERARLAAEWLAEIRVLAGTHYMRPGQRVHGDSTAAPGGGVFSVVRSREQASGTPMWRDLAPDVYWAAGQLTDLLETCRKDALSPPDLPQAPPMHEEGGQKFVAPPGPRF